jgi:polar amino acid transport system permease protein
MQLTIAMRYLEEFLKGLGVTMVLSAEVVLLGTIVGAALVPLRISHNRALSWFIWLFINPFRILPAMVLLVWGFYSLPLGLGIRLSEWWVAVICLGLNTAAFCVEIFRKAVEEVPSDHVEAVQLLGFRRKTVWRTVILPLAFRNASIPYLNQVLQSIKLTVLASLIAVREVYHVTSDIIQQTNKPLEMYTMLAIVVFVPLFLLTIGVEYVELRIRKRATMRRWTWIDEGVQ